ncbi:PREDICTED: uncharacterized protein LOC101312020 [Fragaria vesca subsp. vesca]|uniref:uncharacterized protein LOC101312020 n=1 Tax=Fragaria vesca subsp. vesca TaxID=101020 RepID=UPI0002C36895|nr:PREDICTED: uncharacterized protein LOC101312020 [Fragaria vesca subsp. vesca]
MDKNPSSAEDDVTVFLDTSLDTRLAITVSGNDTISDVKRKFEHEHQLSYGEIKIRALKVDRGGRLYRLSDSMSVKRAAGGVNQECFMFADASIVEKIGEIEHGLHNVGSDVQFIGSGICDNPLVSGADRPFDVVSKRLFSVDDSMPLLIEGNKNNTIDQNGSVDSGRETSKDLEIKHCDDDHRKTSFGETINRAEPERQEDRVLCSEGFRVPTAQDHKEDTSRQEISEAKSSASLEKTSPAVKNKLQEAERKSEEPVQLKENHAPVRGINEEPSRIDIVTPEDLLGNEGGYVPCDTFIVNRTTTEEPCRALAPNLDNKSDSGIHGTTDTYKETEVSGKSTEIRKDISMHCKTTAEDASQSQAASKKKRKFESTTDLEDSLKENNVLISDFNIGTSQQDASQSLTAPKKKRKFENVTVEELSKENKEASQPEIVSELSAGKTASTTLDGSFAETSDMLTKSSTKKKNKKKKKALNPLHQVVDAAPSRSGDMEERSMVVSAEIDIKHSSAENVAPISRQGLKEDNCAPIQELQETPKAPSSLDFNNATQEKPEGHPPVVEAPGENGTGSAEKVQEKREASQTNDSEAMLSESQGKTDGDNAKLIVTSELSNRNEPVTPSKKKKKKKKTKDSSGAEHIIDSQCDISLAEPHEAVHGEQDIDKAKNKESNLSHKNGKDISKKDTESGRLVMEADKHDGNEVETSQQVGKTPENAKSMKKKSKRKHDAMTQDLLKLGAEEKIVSHGDPALTIDSRTEALGSKRKNSKLAKTTPIDQSDAKCMESGREYGVQIGTLHAGSNFVSESTKLPSQQEHISAGTSLQPNISGNHEEVSCEGEEINFHKYMVPNYSKNKVASGELCAEEVAKSKGADNKLKPKKNHKAVDSSGCSHDLQSPLESYDNRGIGKPDACRSSSMQPQGSISNVDVVVSQPEKTVSKSGTKAQSSDASGKIHSIPKVAGKQSLADGSAANSLTKKKNEVVTVSSSKMEKSNITHQNKLVTKHQSGVTQNVVANGKASVNDNGEVLNSSKHKKSSATPVAPEYRFGSEGKDGVVSGASTTSSDYSLSSESDYSDGESNAGSCASSGKKGTGRSGYSSIKGKPATRLKNDEIFLNSSVYKKAKLAASQSQLEEDSQAPEFVPDSQPAL